MYIVEKIFSVFPKLLGAALSCEPFMLLMIALFVVGIVINVTCYFIWGRY